MGFKVEDGTVLDGANSYASVAEFTNYWLDRGKDFTDKEAEEIQAALVVATSYIDARFGLRFKGTRAKTDVQVLAWPRIGARSAEGVLLAEDKLPLKLKFATHEYAMRALTEELAPDITVDPNIASQTVQAGPVHKTVVYSGSAALTKFKPWPMADIMLNELLSSQSGSYR